MHKSRKPKLGQHFLSNIGFCSRVVDALGLLADDLVIEIGPGHGAMTELLASRARGVVAVEIDTGLVDELQQKFQKAPNVEIIHGDVLLTDFRDI